MKAIFTLATIAFWGGVALLVWPAAPGTAADGRPPANVITVAEVARHADSRSCWMAIRGQVYDLTAYLPLHPADPTVLTRHCGREASQAYATKDHGRPHSPWADQLLEKYRIGPLAP